MQALPIFIGFVFLNLSLCLFGTAQAGSQAYNHTSQLKADVNTATGVFQFSHSVISAQGRVAPFSLSLSYRYNKKGRFGLPEGWQFDIHHIDDKTLNFDHQQWLIDPMWHDETLFGSGLKYQNQHGIAFKDKGIAVPIPNYPKLFYRYSLNHKDGSVSYFSEQGLLTLTVDRFNNCIEYQYIEPIASLDKARIRKIIDNYGQTYLFDYDPGAITITYPDARKIVIYHQPKGVHEIVNPLGQSITLAYTESSNATLIESVQTPSGLLMHLSYASILAKTSDATSCNAKTTSNGTTHLPVVSHFSHQDLKTDALLKEKHYRYAQGKNFTGYPKYTSNKNNDSLFDSHDEDYRYSVSVEESNLEEKPIYRTRQFTYNFLHLPVEVITHYQGKPHNRTTYTYELSPFKYTQSTNYDKPKTITHHIRDDKNNQWVNRTKQSHTHDLFGNLTQTQNHVFDPEKNNWVLISTKKASFYTHHYSLPSETQHIDNLNGLTVKRHYTLSSNNNSNRRITSHYKDEKQHKQWQPWQQTETQHDSSGRLIQQTLSWLAADKLGVQKTITKTRYTEDPSQHLLHIDETNALGDTHTKCYDLRNNQYLSYQSPEGDQWKFTHDSLGRLTQTLDPRANKWTKTYADYADKGVNTIEHKTPLGYKTQTHYDAIHRPIKQEDEHKNIWRLLSENKHNGFGQIIKEIDQFGMVKQHHFDGEGRPLNTQDADNNQETFHYDDISQTTTVLINGITQREMQLKPWQLTTIQKQFPNKQNLLDQQTHFIQSIQIDNAIGLVTEKHVNVIDFSSHQIIDKTSQRFIYDGGSSPTKEIATTFNGDILQSHKAFDLFGNRVSEHKTLKSLGGVSEHRSETHHFDAANRLIRVEEQLDIEGESSITYFLWDKNGHKIQTTLPNGNNIIYQYLPGGLLTQSSWQRSGETIQVNRQYDADGRLSSTHDHHQNAIKFNYTPSGHLTNIQYPNDFHVALTYNAFDQLENYSDTHGFKETLTYNAQQPGKLIERQVGPHHVQYIYGKDDNGHRGQIVQRKIINAKTQNTTTESLHYGALGLLTSIEHTDAEAGIHTNTQLKHNAKHLLTQVDTHFHQGFAKSTDTRFYYDYDGFNRLSSEKFTDHTDEIEHQYRYDANHNLIRQLIRSEHGQLDRLHTYNRRDQLTGITYNQEPPKTLTYDDNGYLKTDQMGNAYTFDDRGFLTAIQPPNQSSDYLTKDPLLTYEYWPNGLLASISKDNEKAKTFYYNHKQKIFAIDDKQNTQHFLRAGSGLILGLTTDGLSQLNTHHSNASILQDNHHKLHNLTFSAFGKTLTNDSDNPLAQFAWKNCYRDTNADLVYMTSRFHQPLLSRFIGQDNYSVANRYAFGNGNPILYSDPLGHKSAYNPRADTYIAGGAMTVLGIFGALLAIPSGGASLTLTAGAGIAAGASSVISGSALMGMQGAMDSGNKKAADILKGISTGFGVVAALDIGVAIAPKIPSMLASVSSNASRLADNIGSKIAAWSSKTIDSEVPGTMATSTGRAIPTAAVHIPSETADIGSSALEESWSSTSSSLESSYSSVQSSSSWLSESPVAGALGSSSEASMPQNLSEASNEVDNVPTVVKKVRFAPSVKVRKYYANASISGGTHAASSANRSISASLGNVADDISQGSRMADQLKSGQDQLLRDEIMRFMFQSNLHTPRPSNFQSLVPH